MSTKQKIALVTGGSRGLGKDMSIALAKKGVDIIFTYHSNEAAANETASEITSLGRQVKAMQLDTRNINLFNGFAGELRSYLSTTYGVEHLDYLVNNAGTALYAPVTDVAESAVDEIFDIHFKGVLFLTQKLLPLISDGGAIVNVSSGLTRITYPGSSVYASVKTAVETLTRYMAKELGSRRIRVNVIAPGAIETDFGGGRVRDNKEINEQIAGLTTLGRVGLPDDIGKVVAFLCSDEAGWITGQRIEVSGGQAI